MIWLNMLLLLVKNGGDVAQLLFQPLDVRDDRAMFEVELLQHGTIGLRGVMLLPRDFGREILDEGAVGVG